MGYRVAVVGATGNVGREMLNILAEREFPIDEIVALASRKSLGTECSFGDKTLKTLDLDTFDFKGWDIALFAIGSDATKKYAPVAARAGCVVIDNSSLYRYDPEVPLIVPEVNPDAIDGGVGGGHLIGQVTSLSWPRGDYGSSDGGWGRRLLRPSPWDTGKSSMISRARLAWGTATATVYGDVRGRGFPGSAAAHQCRSYWRPAR